MKVLLSILSLTVLLAGCSNLTEKKTIKKNDFSLSNISSTSYKNILSKESKGLLIMKYVKLNGKISDYEILVLDKFGHEKVLGQISTSDLQKFRLSGEKIYFIGPNGTLQFYDLISKKTGELKSYSESIHANVEDVSVRDFMIGDKGNIYSIIEKCSDTCTIGLHKYSIQEAKGNMLMNIGQIEPSGIVELITLNRKENILIYEIRSGRGIYYVYDLENNNSVSIENWSCDEKICTTTSKKEFTIPQKTVLPFTDCNGIDLQLVKYGGTTYVDLVQIKLETGSKEIGRNLIINCID